MAARRPNGPDQTADLAAKVLTLEVAYLAAVKTRDTPETQRLLPENPGLLWDEKFRSQLTSEDVKWILGIYQRP